MGAICVSPRIADAATNLALAVANRAEIHNGFISEFAKSGKPERQAMTRFFLKEFIEKN